MQNTGSRLRSVHVRNCFADKQNIIHLVAYICSICLQVMKKYLKLRKHTLRNIDRFM